MEGAYWTGSVLLHPDRMRVLGITPLEEVRLSTEDKSISIFVQVVPQCNGGTETLTCALRLHPLVQDLFTSRVSNDDSDRITIDDDDKCFIQYAQSVVEIDGSRCNELNSVIMKKKYCQIEKLSHGELKTVKEGQFQINIQLKFVCSTNKELDGILERCSKEDGSMNEIQSYLLDYLRQEFQSRIIQNKTFLLVSLPPISLTGNHGSHHKEDIAMFFISNVSKTAGEECEISDLCYSVTSIDDMSLSFVAEKNDTNIANEKTNITSNDLQGKSKHLAHCPGYDSLIDNIMELTNINIRGGCPTGIILSGCVGVGKTRLASAVLHRILERERIKSSTSRIISVKELILQASSSMNLEELMKYIAQQTIISERSGRAIIIIDDLDLVIDSADDSSILNEKRIVLNSITRTIDNLNSKQKGRKIDRDVPPIIMGMCCSEKLDPQSDLIRIGRFEKTLVMSPPSEIQRCQILKELFQQLPVSDEKSGTKEEICHTWSIGVGPHTAGCVAADLKRLCTDALTRSNTRKEMKKNAQCDGSIVWADIREAARMCIPSQLAQLDVTLTGNIAGNNEDRLKGLTPKERFFRIWDDKFIGYREIKSKIFRTIYWPWMRHNSDTKRSSTVSALEREVPPSSGVLFHGKSGTGKTYAAECLAISLGLHVVRVRASDVLDQWLGGSEAAIRAIFSRARSAAPCILFFDELDAIATNREDGDGDSSDVHSRLLSTLLNEMDGVNSDNSRSDVLIVGTTNRIEAIDAALKRPGRFEQHILLELPAIPDAQDMMTKFLEKVPMSEDVRLHEFAELLVELRASAADIKGLCSDACLNAISNIDVSTQADDVVLKGSDLKEAVHTWAR